jgi:hypothetical protein
MASIEHKGKSYEVDEDGFPVERCRRVGRELG